LDGFRPIDGKVSAKLTDLEGIGGCGVLGEDEKMTFESLIPLVNIGTLGDPLKNPI